MRINVSLQEVRKNFSFTLSENNLSVGLKLGSVYMPEPYLGDYDVTPSFEAQTLQTKNKTMQDDVTIQSIPVSEVSNPSDGITVTIGA